MFDDLDGTGEARLNGPSRMRDVAALAGVATMTVSRVINGNEHVSEETRERVFRAVKALDYRPNTLARSVTVVVKEHGYSVTMAMSDEDAEAEYEEAILMLQRNLDGLLVIPAARGVSRLTASEFARLPIVTIDRPIPGTRFDSVVVKNAEGSAAAVAHLIGHGHKRIAFVGLSRDLYTIQERRTGYCRAMKKTRLRTDVHCQNWSHSDLIARLGRIVDGPDSATAIFCGNDLMTRNVLHGLAALSIEVPKRVALAGFDDFETADLLDPSVTVVSQPMEAMGRCGAEMLFSRMRESPQTGR